MKTVWIMSCAACLALGCTPTSPTSENPASSAASAVASQSAADADVPELIPGVGIGPVKIGMTRADLDKLGLPIKPGELPMILWVGPYEARLKNDRVDTVYVEIPQLSSGAKVGGKVFDKTAKLEVVAQALNGCGPVKGGTGSSVMPCEGGRAEVIAAGPTGVVGLRALATSPDVTWKHPGMDMTFRYSGSFLTASHKPDGAYLKSEILAKVEDRSDKGQDRPTPFSITISVRVAKLFDVLKSEGVDVATIFPGGTEASFKEEKDFAERQTVSGKQGYSILAGDHGEWRRVVYAELQPSWTLVLECDFVGDVFKPKVPMETQAEACDKVISTLAINLTNP